MFESAERRRLSSIVHEKKDLWVPHLEVINPLQEFVHILVLNKRRL
jgi:hypothetical protein